MGTECCDKFMIHYRDNFTCRYCGARPGSENLEVDHVIPRSRSGSDNSCNLVTACVTCNRRKSNKIVFPADMIECDDTDEGWKVHKSFGVYAVKFNDEELVIEDNIGLYYRFRQLIYDPWLVKWTLFKMDKNKVDRSKVCDFLNCLEYVEQMIVIPERTETTS